MQEYMAAADIIVTKPGGLTTAESLASGLAMVIVNPYPGQEMRNTDNLLEQGIAVKANDLYLVGFEPTPARRTAPAATARPTTTTTTDLGVPTKTPPHHLAISLT